MKIRRNTEISLYADFLKKEGDKYLSFLSEEEKILWIENLKKQYQADFGILPAVKNNFYSNYPFLKLKTLQPKNIIERLEELEKEVKNLKETIYILEQNKNL